MITVVDWNATVPFTKTAWENVDIEELQSRLSVTSNIVTTQLTDEDSDDDAAYCELFRQRQLALFILDINRMEGTISPDIEEGNAFQKNLQVPRTIFHRTGSSSMER